MTFFDIGFIAVLAISVGFGIWRGLVREVLSLVSWVAAFWISKEFAGVVAGWLPASVTNESLRLVIGFLSLMMLSLLVFSLLTMLVVHLVKVAGLKPSDRTLGAFFGLVRGVVIVVILVLVGGMTSAPKQPFWREALMAKPLEYVASWVRPWFPDEVARRVNF